MSTSPILPPSTTPGVRPGTGTPPDEVSRSEGPWLAELDAYLKEHGVTNFSAREVTWLYKPSNPRPPASFGLPRYSEPPRILWPNIARTLQIGEILRARMGHPLVVSTAWRPRSVNGPVYFGAPKSHHQWFAAVDFNLPSNNNTAENRRKLGLEAAKLYLDRGKTDKLGVGVYGNSPTRVHIDAGGTGRPAAWDSTPYFIKQLNIA